MTLPIQFIFNLCCCDHNNNSSKIEVQDLKHPKIKLNYNAKPYQKRNLNETNYNKGYYCNFNSCGTRCFNGATNKSYKNN